MRLTVSILVLCISTRSIQCTVNIKTHGEIWYCNSNPVETVAISPLSSNDLQHIRKLEQVQVMTRHGTRTASMDLQDYFPNSTQNYHCDISTISSRFNAQSGEYFTPLLERYSDNDQFLLQSNCQKEQSWPTLITQHRQNAQILMDAYMNSDHPSQLLDIKITNAQSTSTNYMKFYTSNHERCMLSTIALASHLLNISASNTTAIHPPIQTITNDAEFNPYAPWDNTVCTDHKQHQSWLRISTDDMFDNYIIPKREKLAQKYRDAMRQYTKQGGVLIDAPYSYHEHPSFRIQNFYCNGMDIPLDNQTFWSLVEMGREYTTTQPDRSSNDAHEVEYVQTFQCIYSFMATAMYKRFADNIRMVIRGDVNATKFILHSAHDSSIIAFLSGLSMYDGVVPYFAQFLTLEIYSSVLEDKPYLFRFTHKGEFVPYEYCAYKDFDELCDLNILLQNGLNGSNVTQREWAEQSCKTVLEDCVCGYCATNK
eukprot:123203_1